VVYELANCPPASNAPGTVRYMYNYVLKDASPASCKKANDVQPTITKGECLCATQRVRQRTPAADSTADHTLQVVCHTRAVCGLACWQRGMLLLARHSC
jgi:hypothetical protein